MPEEVPHICSGRSPDQCGNPDLTVSTVTDLVLLGLHCFLRLAHALYCHSGDAWLVLLSPCNTQHCDCPRKAQTLLNACC